MRKIFKTKAINLLIKQVDWKERERERLVILRGEKKEEVRSQ